MFYIVAGPLFLGLMLGGMAFLTFTIQRIAPRTLGAKEIDRLARSVRPVYFLCVAALAALAAVGLVGREPVMSKVMVGVALVAVLCRQAIVPALHRTLDRAAAGDAPAARRAAMLGKVLDALNYAMMGAALAGTAIHV